VNQRYCATVATSTCISETVAFKGERTHGTVLPWMLNRRVIWNKRLLRRCATLSEEWRDVVETVRKFRNYHIVMAFVDTVLLAAESDSHTTDKQTRPSRSRKHPVFSSLL
jgi:hypothetical protein